MILLVYTEQQHKCKSNCRTTLLLDSSGTAQVHTHCTQCTHMGIEATEQTNIIPTQEGQTAFLFAQEEPRQS